MHTEVGTRGQGERHTGREEPSEDRPKRHNRMAAASSSQVHIAPKDGDPTPIWQLPQCCITPLGQEFFPNAQN